MAEMIHLHMSCSPSCIKWVLQPCTSVMPSQTGPAEFMPGRPCSCCQHPHAPALPSAVHTQHCSLTTCVLQPVMLYHPCIMSAFHRMCLARGLAVVVVGFPATPLLALRARFCISAAHKPEDLQQAIQASTCRVRLLRSGSSAAAQLCSPSLQMSGGDR